MNNAFRLYMVNVGALAALLCTANELLRIVAAVVLIIGALPLWVVLRTALQQQFWREVDNVIVASGEQPPIKLLSDPGSSSPKIPADLQ